MAVTLPSQTLGSITLRNWQLRPDAPAIIFEGRTITHREFAERAFRLAHALRRLGVRRGHRVAILAQNCPEYMEVYAAGELGGWTTVTVNYRLAGPEISYILGDSKPHVLIYEAEFKDKLQPEALKALQHVIVLHGEGQGIAYDDAIAAERPEPPPSLLHR
jgi:acyl-CoA synthetase (AMP-forming)/AMP-acid ligase II